MSQNTPCPSGSAMAGPETDGAAADKAKSEPRGQRSHNVVKNGKRTSIRLDPDSLLALQDIARREHVKVNDICTQVEERRLGSDLTFSAAIRTFMLSYYKAAATEEGHEAAGHGQPPLRIPLFKPQNSPGSAPDKPGKKRGRRAKASKSALKQPETATQDLSAG